MMHYGASPILFARARILRNSETRAEKLLWERLSNKQLGVKFRRQHPFHLYIVDFYCHEAKLVIEVDGSIHLLDENVEYDRLRSELINDFDVQVIRFSNEDIYFRIDEVISTIQEIVAGSQ
ncbi:endonuclease domain-containing protein [Dyadobacter sp. CY343]|uniref:endonuclease domain-containing protein n=1 Tax=Dyadobacter sp. CY343 TaxID=2907299 RepID=UPI001F440D2E|nr:endonuclease domain-containing protein [Dyadobacter sp. CY343]MCE7063457.1 endonuclease domain-containing protein [Dyadobacter sp. CY343]